MTFRVQGPQIPSLPQFSRRARIVVSIAVVLLVLFILLNIFVHQYTALLWFDSVHYSSVWRRRLTVEVVMFFVFAIAIASVTVGNVMLAYRLRPLRERRKPRSADGDDDDDLEARRRAFRQTGNPLADFAAGLDDAWQGLVGRARVGVCIAVALVVGVPAGIAAANRWQLWMLWRNSTPFHQTDPQFHRDISYYAFTFPLERFVLNELFAAATLAIIASAITYYLFGGLRFGSPRVTATPACRAHISVLLGFFVLLKAWAYWLDRFALAFSPRGNVTGPSYTDVHATLPAKTILVFIAIICALMFFANVRARNLQLPALAFGLMAVSAILIGGAYPALVQHFKVNPSAQTLEQPYIQRNIDATRSAFGITDQQVSTTQYPGATTSSASTLRADANSVGQIRLLDPNVVSPTFAQQQQIRSFYSFPQTLAVDRYPIGPDGQLQDVDIGVRGINTNNLPQKNWINEHLIYTHGYGVVAADTDQINGQGSPEYVEQNLPPTGALSPIAQPRIYFGTNEPDYSIVGAPPGTAPRELDLPSNTNASGQQSFTYNGGGGVGVGSLFRKLLYAWKFKDKNILLSSGVNSASRILYIRDPRSRVQQVAPWLTLDNDPYPVVGNGGVYWVVDGYTTTNAYPYSEQESLSSTTTDTTTSGTSTSAQGTNTINYIRNSVKAVVNAYTGQVTLYEWNPSGGPIDPVLATWMKAFPGVVQPSTNIPAWLMPHLRYPEDLFNIQRNLIAKYHVTDPLSFYNGTSFWTVPYDPTLGSSATTPQPPYYQTISENGTSKPVFSLTSPLTSLNRHNLTAFLSVNSQPGPDYGHFKLLEVPSNQAVAGPSQVHNDIEANATVSHNLTLLRGPGSNVILGNLLTIPIDGTLFYVEPIYTEASQGGQSASFPILQRVIIDYGGRIGYAPTLAGALDKALGASSPTSPTKPTHPTKPSHPTGPTHPTKPSHPTGPSSSTSAAVKADLMRALAAQTQAQADLRAGNFAAYGVEEKKLAAALAAANKAAGS